MSAEYTYMVIGSPLRISEEGGQSTTREAGALVPEDSQWSHRARSVLLESGRIARVVIMTKAEAKKLRASA